MSELSLQARERTRWFGGLLAMGVSAMLFAALFFAYAYLRARAMAWPPPGLPGFPRLLPTVDVAVAVAASALLHLARRTARPRMAVVLGWLGIAAFVALQLGLAALLFSQGFTLAQTGSYGAIFYGLLFAHAAHGVIALAGVAPALRRPERLGHWTVFWDFLAVVWAAIVAGVIWP